MIAHNKVHLNKTNNNIKKTQYFLTLPQEKPIEKYLECLDQLMDESVKNLSKLISAKEMIKKKTSQ